MQHRKRAPFWLKTLVLALIVCAVFGGAAWMATNLPAIVIVALFLGVMVIAMRSETS